MTNIHFSSAVDTWSTPQDFFDKLNGMYDFTLDPCCQIDSAKCSRFYTPKEDGLAQSWRGERVFMNPPYGRGIGNWMNKALSEVLYGGCELVVCLVPARTDTRWWHEYAMKGDIQFLRGRLKFGGGKKQRTVSERGSRIF